MNNSSQRTKVKQQTKVANYIGSQIICVYTILAICGSLLTAVITLVLVFPLIVIRMLSFKNICCIFMHVICFKFENYYFHSFGLKGIFDHQSSIIQKFFLSKNVIAVNFYMQLVLNVLIISVFAWDLRDPRAFCHLTTAHSHVYQVREYEKFSQMLNKI